MLWKIVLKGKNPSGRMLAVLYARTGETIDTVRSLLDSPGGMILQTGMSREKAEILSAELPDDGSIEVTFLPDDGACIPVLMGYRPGSRGRLRIALQKFSKLPTEQVIQFLASIPIALRSDTDLATAESIKNILEHAGGIVEIRSTQDLIGVSSKKNYSSSLRMAGNKKVVKSVNSNSRNTENNYGQIPDITTTLPPTASLERSDGSLLSSTSDTQNKQYSSNLKPDKTSADPPPVISFVSPDDSLCSANFSNSIDPHVFSFKKPSCFEQIINPPVIHNETEKTQQYTVPDSIKFTIPAVSVPDVIPIRINTFVPPGIIDSSGVFFVYLYKVAETEKQQAITVLSHYLKIPILKVQNFIQATPVAILGFTQRIDALVAITELSDQGLPVSLFSGTDHSELPVQENSFLGWLSEH